ncbi:uncharacterized protein [Physcomitrium patens]|uniref:Uncharacterized protein n=1 Tax=Physcomitrium patens TaxID=3218 RepID=A0A2K1IBP8_PHYPA|nr:dehydrogenase/reductase SDR family member on chromosome X-like [Physcomitrium patens]PNR26687.1 hypothetical protein PHYPA_030168 [Physcomitrium patens]|eukprot:XP_024366412.1 dehydrogenase/reductase SDR family member on chromosome X-like [Physcomitrella patens]
MGTGGDGAGGDVLRLGNLLRMGVLWTLCLIYSHLCHIVLRLRSRYQSQGLRPFELCSPAACRKPACIVTGASSGIGRATASALALRGFHVILAGRSLERLQVVRAEIEAHSPSVSCQTLALDLCSVPSILNFTRTVKKLFEADGAPGKLHLLVNNAGILATSERWTEDGFDVMMASNYLGPYILTRELLPLLQKNAPQARIVNLVSFTHRAVQRAQVNVRQLGSGGIRRKHTRSDIYHLAQIYETSKLFMILFSYELHRQFFSNFEPESRVSVIAADPGAVSTNILREVPSWLAHLSSIVLSLLGLLQPPKSGASAVVAAAMAPWELSGKYVFGNDGLCCKSSSITYDEKLGCSLWNASENIYKEALSRH